MAAEQVPLHLVGVQEVEAPRNVECDAMAETVPQQVPTCVGLNCAAQVAACTGQKSCHLKHFHELPGHSHTPRHHATHAEGVRTHPPCTL